MATYVMLTRVSPEVAPTPGHLAALGDRVAERLKVECPEVRWLASYAVLGPHDYVDVFEAPDTEAAARAALIVRAVGRATTEVWAAVPWVRFRDLARAAEANAIVTEASQESFPASDAPAFATGVQHEADAPAQPTRRGARRRPCVWRRAPGRPGRRGRPHPGVPCDSV
jgi:uncharacterized protein with GYD domain